MNPPKLATSRRAYVCARCNQTIPPGTLHAWIKREKRRYHTTCAPAQASYIEPRHRWTTEEREPC